VDFVAVVDQVIALLRQRGRVAYRTLKVQFTLDDDALEALKDELLYAQQLPVFSANNLPVHARERAPKSLPGAGLRADAGVRIAH